MCEHGWGRSAVSDVAWANASEYWMLVARAALQAIRPQQFGDLPESACQAAEASGAGSYHDAHAIFTAMIEAILEEKPE